MQVFDIRSSAQKNSSPPSMRQAKKAEARQRIDISIVVPVYRVEKPLFRASLLSVADLAGYSSLISVELILVFDGYPDNELLDIVRMQDGALPSTFCYIQNHLGVSAARNCGTAYAHGEWILYLDADDTLFPSAAHTLLDFARRSACDIVMGDSVTYFPTGRTEHRAYKAISSGPSASFALQFRRDVLKPGTRAGLCWAKLYRRAYLEENALRFNSDLTMGEDSDFVFRAVMKTEKIGYVNEPVYQYHRNATSAVRRFSIDYPDRIERSLRAMSEYLSCSGLTWEYETDFADYVSYHLLLILVHYFAHPDAPWTVGERLDAFRKVRDNTLFSWALEKCDPKAFSATRRLSLFALRHRLFLLCWLIGWVRQAQLR